MRLVNQLSPQPPQAAGRTPCSAALRASGTTDEAPQRCPGAEDQPPEASEAPAGEADKQREAWHMSREAARQQLPALMRRDVRLLGDLLGEVIREVGGQDLLDDVERLRRAVIAAREEPPGAADRAGDGIAALVAGWPLARAELVAKAFTIYFHLTNLA